MLGKDISLLRNSAALSRDELASQTQVPVDDLCDWEDEVKLPRKRDLVKLDKVLGSNLSVSTYKDLCSAKRIGQKLSTVKVVSIATLLIFMDLFMTGFGYQPTYVFVILLFLTTFVTFPAFFFEYWKITDSKIEKVYYSNNFIIKTVQILVPTLREKKDIQFSDIDTITIHYTLKKRVSPFDFWPDYFVPVVENGDSKENINIDYHLYESLYDTMLFLGSRNVKISDPQLILKVINNKENLRNHFHLQERDI
ncbi:helix-turn-helix domain-containing protein [Lactiplantibacillus fabifermentans]|uniref:HTH cro/C1-type domain-containing protein n=1 Tax=Lactiplantibacillus fabifermentans DSM 21115 TaxID=1413187 RepID=A0A0R2NRQ2_9LACO|nr:transcriptional regulator [Lactiplantibacillus fabifermentans]KRO28367.1 hypothetical protein DY78_GL002442 [Lactiplantibacillus fabifermentans DSM 21115]